MTVVVGDTTPEPLGAFRTTLARTSPDDESTVVLSVRTVKPNPDCPLSEKVPSEAVRTEGSLASRNPLLL